jgi:hypothetical protein
MHCSYAVGQWPYAGVIGMEIGAYRFTCLETCYQNYGGVRPTQNDDLAFGIALITLKD